MFWKNFSSNNFKGVLPNIALILQSQIIHSYALHVVCYGKGYAVRSEENILHNAFCTKPWRQGIASLRDNHPNLEDAMNITKHETGSSAMRYCRADVTDSLAWRVVLWGLDY